MLTELPADLQRDYDYLHATIGDDDPYLTNSTVGIHEVIDAHYLIAEFFMELGQGIGGVGLRDINLLHSALSRQLTGWGRASKWTTSFEVCATTFYGLIKDHPFHDANKRTAFLSCLYHLQKIGRVLTVPQKEFEDLAVDVAENNLAKFARYRELRRRSNPDPEVNYLAHYLRKNTRVIDKRYYRITYRQLEKIMRRFGYSLENPHGNFIDVMRVKTKRRLFGIGSREQVNVKVAQIGFPSWTSQVNPGAIKTIRTTAGLVAEKGFDSATFFKNAEPVGCLIAEYQEPLIRLARR